MNTVFKRMVDLGVAVPVSVVSAPIVGVLAAAARVDTSLSGIFRQRRVGRHGDEFTLYKLRSMSLRGPSSTVTVAGDPSITRFGAFLRRFKFDELPQFWNVVLGHMSVVGPRPDVAGFADQLEGDDRRILALRPGITGPASLLFSDEEMLLDGQDDPVGFNRDVIWPLKVEVNCAYADHATLADDLKLILWTLRLDRRGLKDMFVAWGVGPCFEAVEEMRTVHE